MITGRFYFSGSNTWDINMTETNAMIPSNENAPLLNDPSVNPSLGNLTTTFSFTVNYSDADNNAPISINVIINDTLYQMSKQNPLDTNYTDGVIYKFSTFLPNGIYEYYFNTTDGPYFTSIGPNLGPMVYYNNSYSPILNNPSLFPELGYNSSTTFLFKINYSDQDNNPAQFINITINGTNHSMQQANSTDLNYMDGVIFEYSTILEETGEYVYNFTASDGENVVNLPGSGFYHNPNVTRHDLNGVDIGWIISHGEYSNSTYSTFLTDAINLGATSETFSQVIDPFLIYPYEVLIMEEGGSAWTEVELHNLKYWVENGGRLIIIGNNQDDAQVSVSSAFNISYSAQGGTGGVSSQIFNPHYLTVNVNTLEYGSPSASINLTTSNNDLQVIANTSDELPQVGLLELGKGKVLWIVDEIIENFYISDGDNREFGLNVLRWMGEVKTNNNMPFLSDLSFTPATGNSTTYFTFQVNYTDADNKGPIYINLTVNNASFQMIKKYLSDFNYADGVIFEYSLSLQNGTTQYHINASDGENNISSSELTGPTVNYVNDNDPLLSSSMVSPNSAYEHKIFTFLVNYSDLDNNEPKYVNVTIDGTSFQMEKLDPSDNSYINGVIYEYKTLLSLGTHEYYFNASDEERTTSIGLQSGPMVIASPLKDVNIVWIMTHGEDSNSSYTRILNDAIDMGATVTTLQSEINDSSLQNFDVIVIGEGGGGWSSAELDSAQNWVINGGSVLILGDNRDSSQVSISLRFSVYYSSQSGSGGYYTNILHPHEVTGGVSSVYFPYPSSSISTNSNTYLTPLITDPSERTTFAALQYGSGKLIWLTDESFINSNIIIANNSLLCNNTWIWLANTISNENQPVINEGDVNPSTGDSRITYNFYLNYSDPDGSAPVSVSLTINGSIYQMQKFNITNYNYTFGTIYNYSIQLSPGVYNYHFNISDGKFNVSHPAGQLSLTVTSVNLEVPIFTSISVDPYLGFGNQALITFQVNYQDLDNTPPNYIRVNIDGTLYNMAKLDPFDLSYYNGVIYQFQKNLSIGQYHYSFHAFDGIYTISEPNIGTNLGPIIVESKPLNSIKIGWVDAHGEDDYLSYTITLNDAVAMGASFEYISSTITGSVLNNYDIIVVEEGGSSWSQQELDALASWVSQGGALFVIGDDRDNAQVSVSAKFGVYYKVYSNSFDFTSDFLQPHTLTNGLSQLYTYPYTAIDETSSTNSLEKIVRDKNGELIVAYQILGTGKITWICDDDIIRNAYIDEGDNWLFANNTWLWAMEPVQSTGSPEDTGDGNGLIIVIVITILAVSISVASITFYVLRKRKISEV